MICLDCAQESRIQRVAVGACTSCGAGVCLGHAVVTRQAHTAGPGSVLGSASATVSRKLTCVVCYEAVFGPAGERLVAEVEASRRPRLFRRGVRVWAVQS
jgi:hypothetical protein